MSFFESLKRQKFLFTSLIVFTLSVGILIGTLITTGVEAAKDTGQKAADATPLVIPSPVQLQNDFSRLAKQLEPSVVNISSVYEEKPARTQRRRGAPNEEGDEGEMDDFFFRFFGRQMPNMPQTPRRSGGVGSGVIVDKNGYILTNHHVVDGASRIKVKLWEDTTEYDAKVIGSDQETDLAVIKITAKGPLSAAKVGNSDAVNVGDWAVAIGSPFGLQATVTVGIISAKQRDQVSDSQFQNFIQTDAAINPGNSGGPLINIRGELIGINTAIATNTGSYNGVGFALPINMAVKVYNQIIKSGKVTRGSIGVTFREVKPELLKVYGAEHGVFVHDVQAGGPSEKAGIQKEDIIVAINGKPVRNGQDLVERVADTPVGEQATITVIRDKNRRDIQVTIGDRTQVFAERFGAAKLGDDTDSEGTPARFGITIEDISDARRSQFGIKEPGGVLISKVEGSSFADDIGVLPSDILLAINRQPVNSVADVKRLQATLKPGDAVAFRILRAVPTRRGGQPQWSSVYLAGTLNQ